MIEVIYRYKPVWGMFTLASMLDWDGDSFRLHVGFHEDQYDTEVVKWISNNFKNFQIYNIPSKQANGNWQAKFLLQLRRWWRPDGKGSLNKRCLVFGDNRIFLRNWVGQIPPADWQKGLVMTARKWQYVNHPMYQNYYAILGVPHHKDDQDTNFMLLNWEEFEKINDFELFFPEGRASAVFGLEHRMDAYINGARNSELFKKLKMFKHGFMPLYASTSLDYLIKVDSIGTADCLNHNILMRKSFSMAVEHKYLVGQYSEIPVGASLAIPYDLYTNLIDKIPLNLRNARINESLLLKASKQKQVARKVIETGYILGKVY